MNGAIQVGLDAAAALKPFFDSGRLRPLAVVSARRSSTLPDVIGMQEAGFPGVDVIAWTGLTAPAKTPRNIIDLVNKQFNAILKEPDLKKVFFNQGYEPAGGSPEDMSRLLANEVAAWSKVIKTAKIQFE